MGSLHRRYDCEVLTVEKLECSSGKFLKEIMYFAPQITHLGRFVVIVVEECRVIAGAELLWEQKSRLKAFFPKAVHHAKLVPFRKRTDHIPPELIDLYDLGVHVLS